MNYGATLPRFVLLLAILVLVPSPSVQQARAFSPSNGKSIVTLLKSTSPYFTVALSAEKVNEFARIALKPGGTRIIRDEIGKMNLPDEVIEDTFARILVVQGRAQRSEADGWMSRLSGVSGFRGAMSKSMGASEANTIGHLYEVKIADSAAQANFKIHGIGVRFKDPHKKGETDIDVLLERNGRLFAIEAKAYPGNAMIPLDTFRADMLTLAEYRKDLASKRVVPVFAISNRPANPDVWRRLEYAAKEHGIELLVGSPDELVHQLPMLVR